ncbi:hypothetical protein AGMMS49545_15960 [Betaproteobacteria bacterium]|nr:hypothetical protein AGMMS49545_15960 [Betaproteobacteria bacterium]GHU47951.1 hypothetical protein AGMMS50289_23900 [Betaproteobacteria bacterium]
MNHISLVASILNPPELTDNFLARLATLREHEEFDLVLVCDGDTNMGTHKAIKRYEKCLRPRVIFHDTPQGYSSANNVGAEAASGTVLIFINTDVFPAPGAITMLANALLENPEIGIAQGLLTYPQTGRVQSCGHIFGNFFNRHALMGRPLSVPIVHRRTERQALTSAYYAVRRADFMRLGGFDEIYLNCYEGMELALRLNLEGRRCLYIPESQAHHLQGGSRRHFPADEHQQDALFWSRWHDRIRRDLDDLLGQQLLREHMNTRYLTIDASTNRFWYETLDALTLHAETVARPTLRGHTLILQDTLSAELHRCHAPLLFLTDHFSQVSSNRLWFAERPHNNDMLLDCHGNVITMSELLD